MIKNQDLNKNLSRLGQCVMFFLLPFAIGLMVAVYYVVQSLGLPSAVVVILSIIILIAWIVGGGLVGNWVRNVFWKGVRGKG